ncbi:fimbrial protein [Pantoea sp. BRR-3P]|uniref:fimbrial protein n=1 Tax=Pantoea sp. BRR-3P TaxID=3141541 RepID=UPI0031F4F7C6
MKKWMVALAIALFGSSAAIGGELPTFPFTVSGTIIAAPCKINKDQLVTVEFGDVAIQAIDGVRYEQDVPTSISCESTFTGDLSLSIKAESAGFGSNAAATDNSDLAIQFTRNGEVVQLNQLNDINWRNPLNLKAVPVINPSATPVAGEFKASVTLLLGIQ